MNDLRAPRHKPAHNGSLDRLPPNSNEAEQGVLACILQDPKRCMPEVMVRFGSKEDFFYDLRHQTIYRAMLTIEEKRENIDLITLQQRLKDAQLLEQVGGLTYISTLPDCAPSAFNLESYLDIIIEKAVLRNLVRAAVNTIARVYDNEADVPALVDQAEREVLAVRNTSPERVDKTVKSSVSRVINRIEDYHARQGQVLGMTTGFPDLDHMTSGLLPGQMVVVAARPSQGKTSLVMNIVEHVTMELQQPAGVFSLETGLDNLVMRMMCSRARVNARHAREGFLAERDFPKITGAAGRIVKAPLYIDDASGLTIMDLRARARRMLQQYGIKLLAIDYIQLLTAIINGRRIEKREREISEISQGVKSLAKELGIPIIVVAQLSRDVEKQKRKPNISDLRESGQLEQDADMIGLLHRDRQNEDDQPADDSDCVPMVLNLAKQKDGPTGLVHLTFLRAFTRFESAAKIGLEDEPDHQGSLPYQ